MGKALETIGVQATAPGASPVTFAAFATNSLTIRDAPKPARIIAVSGNRQTAAGGFVRITSPLLHDSTFGIQEAFQTGAAQYIYQGDQPAYPQDTLTVTGTGSATAGDIENNFIWVYYPDLPGVDGNMIDEVELSRRTEEIYTVLQSQTPSASGGWSTGAAINATQDQFKANREYAILGAYPVVSTALGAIRVLGTDWGNLGVGIPQSTISTVMGNWFVRLSRMTGLPTIPVLNSSNKGTTVVQCAANENATAITFMLRLALLAPKARR